MNNPFKKNLRNVLIFITSENVQLVLSALILLAIIVLTAMGKILPDFEDSFSLDILISGTFFLVCACIARILKSHISKYIEDSNKLIVDYTKIVGYYSRNKSKMLDFTCTEINNNNFEDGSIDEAILNSDNNNKYNILPITTLHLRKINENPFNFTYKLSDNPEYQLPELLNNYTSELRSAHEKSNILFNNMMIRLDDFKRNGNDIELSYSYTTYFNHLFTNRAIDYLLSNGLTIRNMYEPGPFIKTLKESNLSNHIGFNGFIEFSDGKIVFLKRNYDLSTNKNLWQPSVSGSLKPKFCLDRNKHLTNQGISDAIKNEIIDELKIDKKYFDNEFDFSKSIFAFYRDFVEGGKPHFVFYYRFDNLDSKEFKKLFMKKYKKMKKEDKKNAKIDGNSFKFAKVDDLRRARIENGTLLINAKNYATSASYLGALKLFLLAKED